MRITGKMRKLTSSLMAVAMVLVSVGCASNGGQETHPTDIRFVLELMETTAAITTEPMEESKPAFEAMVPAAETIEPSGRYDAAASTETNPDTPAETTLPATDSPAAVSQTTQPVHTHSYISAVAAPTCTESGYTLHTCSCGKSYQDSETTALGHSWGEWIINQEATTSAEGEQTRTCSRCGSTETQVIAKLEAEGIDTAVLAAYGRSYDASNYDFVPNIGTRAGYFPGYRATITTMEEGCSAIAGCVDDTAGELIAVHETSYFYLDVEVVYEAGNQYIIWVYYG